MPEIALVKGKSQSLQKALVLAMLLILGAALAAGTTEAQTPPSQSPLFPGATFRNVQTPAAYFDLAQAVVEYEGGAFTASESVPYVRFFTIMEGELTFTVGDKTDVYAAGKNFSVPAGIVAKGSNEGRKTRARVYVSSLVPAWASGSTILPGTGPSAPAPRTVYTTRFAVQDVPEVIDVLQWGFRYPAGFVTPMHVMNEFHGFLLVEGTTSFEYLDGGRESYSTGQGAQMYTGRPGQMGNRTQAPTAWLNTWLATPGAPVTSPASAPAAPAPAPRISPPSTGDAGLVSAVNSRGNAVALVLLAVLAQRPALLVMRGASRGSAERPFRQ